MAWATIDAFVTAPGSVQEYALAFEFLAALLLIIGVWLGASGVRVIIGPTHSIYSRLSKVLPSRPGAMIITLSLLGLIVLMAVVMLQLIADPYER